MACASAHAAEPVALSGENLKQMVPGSAIAIDTPLNSVVPIRFTADGLMTGEAGSLASYLGAERDRGRWWIAGDQLCLKWFRWFDAKERCMVLHREGNRVQWAEGSGESGTATITEAPKTVVASAPALTARSHASGPSLSRDGVTPQNRSQFSRTLMSGSRSHLDANPHVAPTRRAQRSSWSPPAPPSGRRWPASRPRPR